MTHRQEVGKRIAQARREMGVREQRDVLRGELAEAVGVDPSTITAWEQGKKSPREEALAKLAAFLGVTPAFLRYGIPADYKPTVQPDPALDRPITPGERAAAKRVVDSATPRQRRRDGSA